MRFLEVLFARCLVVQDVGSFGVETLGSEVDANETSRMSSGASPVAKVSAKDSLNERGTRAFGAGKPINFREQVPRECDGSLLFHTTNILPQIQHRSRTRRRPSS